jgi:hypothetical protein
MLCRHRRDGEGIHGVHRPIAKVSGVVVVQLVVVRRLAVRRDLRLERLQIINDRWDAGLCGVGTGAVGAAGVSILRIEVVGARRRVWIFHLTGGWNCRVAFAVVCQMASPNPAKMLSRPVPPMPG